MSDSVRPYRQQPTRLLSLGFSRQEHWSGAISFSKAWKWKVKVKSLSHVWLCNPMDCSLPGSSVHGIFQATVLERGAIAFSDNEGDLSSIPGLGRSPGEGIGCPVFLDSPCGSAGKEPTCNAGDLGSVPGLGRSPGEGKGYPLQYSGLENFMDCIDRGVAKSWTRLNDFHIHAHMTVYMISSFSIILLLY